MSLLVASKVRELQKEQILSNIDKRIMDQINSCDSDRLDRYIYIKPEEMEDYIKQSLVERGFVVDFETNSYKVSW